MRRWCAVVVTSYDPYIDPCGVAMTLRGVSCAAVVHAFLTNTGEPTMDMTDAQTPHAEGVKKIAELIKDLRMAMLVTIDERGFPNSRPMATQGEEFSGTVWFFTDRNSPKVRDVANNPSVNVVYMKSADESYLSLVGAAEVDNDRDRMRAMWSPWMKAWFDSAEDPELCLLRVNVEEAEYWDTPGGKVASLISLVKGAVTGDPGDMESNHTRVAF